MIALWDVAAEEVRQRINWWAPPRERRERLTQQNLLAVCLVHVKRDSGLTPAVRLDGADEPIVEKQLKTRYCDPRTSASR